MPFRAFAAFVLPSLLAMLAMVAIPLAGVAWLSFWNSYTATEVVEVQTRSPFGVTVEQLSRPVLDTQGEPLRVREWYGLGNFVSIIEPERLGQALAALSGPGGLGERLATAYRGIVNLDFWEALEFTLVYTAVTTPLVLLIGFLLALAVDNAHPWAKGALIFATLLPFIVTPVVGALSIKWLFLDNAVVTVLLESLGLGRIYFMESPLTVRFLIILYGVWHVAPFAFMVLYAGLQTVPKESLEAALVDGATRTERVTHVIVPHLAPLFVFITLIHVMDAYRLFEPVLVFSGGQFANSLQHLTYTILDIEQNYHRASASALLTVAGVLVLLIPIVVRTWRDERKGA